MRIRKVWHHPLCALLLLLSTTMLQALSQAGMWTFAQEKHSCFLHFDLVPIGTISIEQYRNEGPQLYAHLEGGHKGEVRQPRSVIVSRVKAPWQVGLKNQVLAELDWEPADKYPLHANTSLTQIMIDNLKMGRILHFHHNKPAHIYTHDWDLPAYGFKKAYREFYNCQKRLYQVETKHVKTIDIFFDYASDTLSLEGKQELEKLLLYIAEHPQRKLRIKGYTDSVGMPQDNTLLSERRVRSVLNYLFEHGVGEDAVEAHYFGERRPFVANDSSGNRAQNRRVRIELVLD